MSAAWIRDCLALLDDGSCVLVTLRQVKGSSPRESGARMVVGAGQVRGSIGGGNLEHQALATARAMLKEHGKDTRLEPYGLGPALNQCCGGAVELLFEVLTPPVPGWLVGLQTATRQGDLAVLATPVSAGAFEHVIAHRVGHESSWPPGLRPEIRQMLEQDSGAGIRVLHEENGDWWLQRIKRHGKPLWLFGAGHVGKAVVKALADLPFEIHWLDTRPDEFPQHLPGNVMKTVSDDLPARVNSAPPDAIFIVMTHSHELDEDICHAVMDRGEFAFLGMIGSASKARRFAHRLARRGIDDDTVGRLVCPVGLPAIAGKEPATIALSLAAQLMSVEDAPKNDG